MSPSRRRAIGAVRGMVPRALLAAPLPRPRRVHRPCPVAVGRDVPIAPPRPTLVSRCVRPTLAPRAYPSSRSLASSTR